MKQSKEKDKWYTQAERLKDPDFNGWAQTDTGNKVLIIVKCCQIIVRNANNPCNCNI